MKRSVIQVFLASPNDLAPERDATNGVVERLNQAVSRSMGWSYDVFRWEETPPGRGRPQGLINKHIRDCELFIGILWQRWGVPTGECDSGFEEEFEIARKMAEETGSPEIWLYFKKVDDEREKDPGAQLSKVLAFKQELVREKEFLYKAFTDLPEWESTISTDLLTYVLERKKAEEESSVVVKSVGENAGLGAGSAVVTPSSEGDERSQRELSELLAKTSQALAEGAVNGLTLLDRTRLLLIATSWFAQSHAGETLSVHEANLAYGARTSWDLSPDELLLLFRTMVADRGFYCPGWFWFRKTADRDVDFLLATLASRDAASSVRRGAFALLADMGRAVSKEIVSIGLKDRDPDVVLEAIRLSMATGGSDWAELMTEPGASEVNSVRAAAQTARVKLLFKESADLAFAELIERRLALPEDLKDPRVWQDKKLAIGLAQTALAEGEASARLVALQYLRLSGSVEVETCSRLVGDPSADVRVEALDTLIDHGHDVSPEEVSRAAGPFVDAERVHQRILRKAAPLDLLTLIRWNSPRGSDAYRLLAMEHFDLVERRIRIDLDAEFENVRRESEAFSSRTVDRNPRLWEVLESKRIEDFIRGGYIGAALAGLAMHGKPEDVRYGRRFVSDERFRLMRDDAIRLVRKTGDDSDADLLLDVARRNMGPTRVLGVCPSNYFPIDVDQFV